MFNVFQLGFPGGNWNENVEVIDQFEKEDGYYLYIPKQNRSEEVIVMVHGYGALNPQIYGSWIKHLCDQGHIVIYPRYQDKIFGTKTKDFARHVAQAVRDAKEILDLREMDYREKFHYTGHSYGGAITAYIGVYYKELKLNIPASIQLCQPGTGPLKGLRLSSYEGLSNEIPMAIMVGAEDKTVGEYLGRLIYKSSTEHNQKIFIRHLSEPDESPPITASHYEPYAIDAELDNQIKNYTSKKAIEKAKLDEVDYLYWDVLDQLISQPESLFGDEVVTTK